MSDRKGIRPLIKEYRLLWKALAQYEQQLKERSVIASSDEERGEIDAELQDAELCRQLLAGGMRSDGGADPASSD